MSSSSETQKRVVAEYAASLIRESCVVGIGSGSTVQMFVEALATVVKRKKLQVQCVTASYESSIRCRSHNLSVIAQEANVLCDISFDGADEVDPLSNAIKGRGGALLREKFIAVTSKRFILMVDESKLVKKLGEKAPVPIQIFPEALDFVTRSLDKLGSVRVEVRGAKGGKDGPLITEQGHMILDVVFPKITSEVANQIKQIVGVVEHGIFWGLAHDILISKASGLEHRTTTT